MNAERSNTPAPSTRNLLEHMGRDKKVADGRVTFVLARAIGEAFLTRDVQMSDVEAVLDNSLSA
jgi:3-dehydroquinate synthetase